jgi:hypothetical protein
MRQLSTPKARTAIGVVAAVAAVVALVVAIPVVAISQQTSRMGGSPSNVYTQTLSHVCLTAGNDTGLAMEQEITLGADSHVLVYFTTRWGRLDNQEEGTVSLGLDQTETFGWSMSGSHITRTTQTVMWTFADVQPGPHNVKVFASVGQPSTPGDRAGADLTECALTVFVIPSAE